MELPTLDEAQRITGRRVAVDTGAQPYAGPVDTAVPAAEYAEWERAAAAAARLERSPVTFAQDFLGRLRARHGEDAVVAVLGGVWDPLTRTWHVRCPVCRAADDDPRGLFRPLTLARNGRAACVNGCDFTALLMAAGR